MHEFFTLYMRPPLHISILCLLSAKREIAGLQQSIQEKNGEIRQLKKQLEELERDKHTEVVKLRLEVQTMQCMCTNTYSFAIIIFVAF